MTPPTLLDVPDHILSPDEFDQAQTMAPSAITRDAFPDPTKPIKPPALAPSDATRRLDPNSGPSDVPVNEQAANALAWSRLGRSSSIPGVLTRQIAVPVLAHPYLTTAALTASAAYPLVGVALSIPMVKDIVDYGIQRHAEAALSPADRAIAEGDPSRVPGERVAVEAATLGLAGIPLVKGSLRAIREGGAAAPEMNAAPDPGRIVDGVRQAPATPLTGSPPAGLTGLSRAGALHVPGTPGTPGTPGAPTLHDSGEEGVAGAGSASATAAPEATGTSGVDGEALAPDVAEPTERPEPTIGGEVTKLHAAVLQHMHDLADRWRAVFPVNPNAAATGATENILRGTTGESAQNYEQLANKLDAFRRGVRPLPMSDKLGFYDAAEGGRSQASAAFQPAADMMRTALDQRRTAIQATGELEHYIQNYMPHSGVWDDSEATQLAFEQMSGGGRTLEGGKSFLKQRVFPTVADGIQAGAQVRPDFNPVDAFLLNIRSMDRYLMSHSVRDDMQSAGLTRLVRSAEEMRQATRDGYAPIKDNAWTIFGPRQGGVTLPEGANIDPEDVTVQGRRIMGQYYAPKDAAATINNFLSPDLPAQLRDKFPGFAGEAAARVFDAYRGLGNSLNQAQLGLSAFHLGMTSLDATVSRAALGSEYLMAGHPVDALKNYAMAPFAPVTNMIEGAKIRQAYLQPETAPPEYQALANAVKEAGGRVRQDSFYSNNNAYERLMTALRQHNLPESARMFIPGILEGAAKPIMEHVVPLQKLGVFGDMAKKVLGDLPPEATLADRRAALGAAWNSVDNRMGQLVYDNLFWNRTVKDLSMASVRSVGWNLGTIRELGGGMLDLGKLAGNAVTGGDVTLSHRAAYAATLPIVVGLYGAAYQYLRTGQGPTELKDYYFPKTGDVDADGNPDRMQLPSYMKDVLSYSGAPWETVKHKINPLLATVVEMLNNKDYYGDEIVNKHDPLVDKFLQEAKYVGKNSLPFVLQNIGESGARGSESALTKYQSVIGITPAPREKVRSDAQNLMADYLNQTQITGATPEDAEARKSRSDLLGAMRTNDGSPGASQGIQDAVTDAIERHQLTAKDVVQLLRRAGTTPAAEKFKSLTLPQALDVFKASTPAEKAKFAAALSAKIDRAISRGDPLPSGPRTEADTAPTTARAGYTGPTRAPLTARAVSTLPVLERAP